MPNQPLYKYRSLDNWKFVIDAIANSRLYAATFDTLNDPMEGRYYYFGDDVSRDFRRAIFESRKRRRICSLSKTRDNTLLWSYYGGGHKGIALGVQLQMNKRPTPLVRDVTYDNVVSVRGKAGSRSADAAALDILTQKQLAWQHEKEVRVFTDKPYVAVILKELVFGCLVDLTDQELVRSIAKKWHPRIRITKLNRSMMDVPLPVEAVP
jgi:hypothetical protein